MITGPFMIILCRLATPVSIRPPQTPQLKPFTFFTSPLRQRDGSEGLYLHMGYFETLSDAEKWLSRIRSRYPSAVATHAPVAALQQHDCNVSTPETADTLQTAVAGRNFSPVEDEWFTDTQLMEILETRRVGAIEDGTTERDSTGVELLRPDDTGTRRILKEAVAKGAPIPFAVQLYWSEQPIDPTRVRRLDIFKAYTLYRTERRRAGHSCYFLRLGFFTDAISAKEVACSVRSIFSSAAVVPVTEQELMHANEARIDTLAPADPFRERIDEVLDSDRERFNAPAQDLKTSSSMARTNADKSRTDSETLEQLQETLELLAKRERWRERWKNSDSLSDSGVRHLRVGFGRSRSRRAESRR